MNKNLKILIWPVFIVMVLAQFYVPAKMISHNENILRDGQEFKFETRPIDPTDPLRGKYIVLDFKQRNFDTDLANEWERKEDIYVSIFTDVDGFAKIKSISKSKPSIKQDYVKAEVLYASGKNGQEITIHYPFNRFYMEESKAYPAEKMHRESQRDSGKITYALVAVKDGDAVLKDVLIDGISLRILVKNEHERTKNEIDIAK